MSSIGNTSNQKRVKKIAIICLAIVMLFLCLLVAPRANAATYGYESNRGSWFLWTKDNTYWYTGNYGIYSHTNIQHSGWLFPCYITNNGWWDMYSNSANFQICSQYNASGGIPTPWGNISVYGTTISNYLYADRYGKFNAWI